MAYPIITVKESSTEIRIEFSADPNDYVTIRSPAPFRARGAKGKLKGNNPKKLFDCNEDGEIEIESG